MAKLSAVAQRVRRRMAEMDIRTIKELEDKAGIPRDTIRHLISGRTASIRSGKIAALALALNMEVGELLHGTPVGHATTLTMQVMDQTHPESQIGRVRFDGQVQDCFGATGAVPFWMVAHTDNMSPTIINGDVVLVDSNATDVDSDGIYLIAGRNGSQSFRRVQISAVSGLLSIANDNSKYIAESGVKPADLRVMGRIVGVFRRL